MARLNPIQCIVPPHVLREIAANGTPSQREYALRNFTMSEQMRGQRLGMISLSSLIAAGASDSKQCSVYDAKQGSSLPGIVVRREGDPQSSDVDVDEAYDGAGLTYDLFHDIYGRRSIDNNGMHLDSTVHYQKGYDNAFWNGQQMVYGDGDEDLPLDEQIFNRFTISIDVIGHELTHGVTQYEAGLVFWDQPGALNESFSDVFGSLVKQYQGRQVAAEADWIIGEGLLTANVKGVGLRSMKAPGTAYNDPVLGKDPQPAHMKDYVQTTSDSGGVHINSGIPNHAFYVTATEMGGYAWEKAGLIWYITLKNKLAARADFQEAARQTFQVAGEQFGAGGLEQQAVKKGWAEVGLDVDAPPTVSTQGGGCLTAMLRAVGLAR
jgi:Zn-dependent metalloprotease